MELMSEALKLRFENMWPHLNERQRRLFAASEAQALGYGGITTVSKICGLSRVSITNGIKNLLEPPLESDRIRKSGGGRPTLTSLDYSLIDDIKTIVESTSRGEPDSSVLWTCLSTRKIANQLQAMGHIIGYRKGGQILHDLGYTLQSNKKVLEGKQHQDRNKQFLFINALINESLKNNQPVISVDTKKKELVGNYKNNGVIWRPAKDPIKVNTYDFPDPTIPKAIPYGIYDMTPPQ